jgi:sporulation protein YqfC
LASEDPRTGDGPRIDPARGGLLRRLTRVLDLPQDLVFDLPRITVVGRLQMTVENHRGLVEFSPTRVVIGSPQGRIVILGQELHIGVIHEEEITVAGQLRSIRFRL